MGFKANQSEAAQNSSIKPEGDYECIIVKCEEHKYTKNNEEKKCLNISYVIRNDIDQKYKNGYIFDTLWKRKEPTEADMSVNGYGFGQIMALGKAAKLPDGKDYENLEQFINELIKKPVRVTIKHKEYNSTMQESVSYINITKFPDCHHTFKSKTDTSNTYAASKQSFASGAVQNTNFEDISVSDEDLPF